MAAVLLGRLASAGALHEGEITWQLTDPAAVALQKSDSEAEVLAVMAGLAGKSASGTTDQVRLAAATRLADTGTTASLPALLRLAREHPAEWVPIPGCRRVVMVPNYPFPAVAERAIWHVERRRLLQEYRLRLAAGDAPAVDELESQDPDGPAVAALQDAARELEPRAALALAQGLRAEDLQHPAVGRYAAALYRQSRTVPEPARLVRLHPRAALDLLLDADVYTEGQGSHLLTAMQGHPQLGSLATVLAARADQADGIDALLSLGSEGAMLAAEDKGADRTGRLAAAVSDREGGIARRRTALQALILQDTAASRSALGRLLSDGAVDEAWRDDVEGVLR